MARACHDRLPPYLILFIFCGILVSIPSTSIIIVIIVILSAVSCGFQEENVCNGDFSTEYVIKFSVLGVIRANPCVRFLGTWLLMFVLNYNLQQNYSLRTNYDVGTRSI